MFSAFELPIAAFVCETGPLFPGLLIRTVTTRLPAPSCVTSVLPTACWSVDPSCPAEVVFEPVAPATATFVCEIGPSSPGLSIRIVMTMFVGCCCVADASAPAI